MLAGGRAASIRVTCTAQPGGTRIHVHQPDGASALTVDVARLNRVLALQQAHERKGQSC